RFRAEDFKREPELAHGLDEQAKSQQEQRTQSAQQKEIMVKQLELQKQMADQF
ncbi:hypothetical protein BGZ80_006877, partial [Entomortierella chlamydospora]